MKLLRLQTENDNAIFNCNFDSDIILKDNAQIALKNIVFEPNLPPIIANSDNMGIFFRPESTVPNDFVLQEVLMSQINGGNISIFFKQFENALNRSLSWFDGATNSRSTTASSSMFKVRIIDGGKVEISFVYSPVISIFKALYQIPSDIDYFEEHIGNDILSTEAITSVDNDLSLFKDADQPAVTHQGHRFMATGGLGLAKGSGCFYARIHKSVVDGSNSVAHNGFSIGITFNQSQVKAGNNTIDEKNRNIEVTYRDPNTNYSFRFSNKGTASTETASNLAPKLVIKGVTDTRHDIILFKIDNSFASNNKVITASILQFNTSSGEGDETILFEHQLTDDDLDGILAPYICFYGNKNNIMLDCIRFSPDVSFPNSLELGEELITGGIFPVEDSSPLSLGGGGVGVQNVDGAMVTKAKLNLNQVRFNHDEIDPQVKSDFRVKVDLAKTLGILNQDESVAFGSANYLPKIDNLFPADSIVNVMGWQIRGDNSYKYFFKDFFLVETMSIPLESYNSSRNKTNDSRLTNSNHTTEGARRNILDTIPYSSLTTGHIEYTPNEMVFIDIKNSNHLNLRNIKLRILDSDLEPVTISGDANITLLIKD